MSWMKSGTKISRNGLSEEARARFAQRRNGISSGSSGIKIGWYHNLMEGSYWRLNRTTPTSFFNSLTEGGKEQEHPIGFFQAYTRHDTYVGAELPKTAKLSKTSSGEPVYIEAE